MFIEILTEDSVTHQPGSEYTQISGTVNTYLKSMSVLLGINSNIKTVLDYGAGKGLGSEAIMNNYDFLSVETFEPHPPKNFNPTYKLDSNINLKYDAILCIYVLNVVDEKRREGIVKNIIRFLKPNGLALFIVRSKSSVMNVRAGTKGSEDGSIYHNQKKKGQVISVYQKGFDKNELKDYLSSFEDVVLLDKNTSNLGNVSCIIKKL